MSHPARRRLPLSTRRRLLSVLTAALCLAGVGAGLSPAAGAATGSTGRWVASWVAPRSTCATPATPDGVRCFVESLVQVPAYTTGAHPRTAVGHGPVGGYSPADLAKAYGYNRTAPVDQTVALVDWYDDPYVLADLNHFNAHYGFPAETSSSFRKVNQYGRTSPLPKADRGSAGEIALDVQAVRAVCAKCRILLVEASNSSDSALAAAENTAARLGATEISNSWGGGEGGEPASLRNAFYHPGVVITASTGDSGWYGYQDGDGAPSFPSTSPYVVAVGGTKLVLDSSGHRVSESVWHSSLGAAGGGCSTHFGAYGWQTHVPGWSAVGCGSHRGGVDIAALADPQTGLDTYDRYGTPLYTSRCSTAHPSGGCWLSSGGTSLSSPVVAALFALAGGSHGSAYPAATLYVNAARRAGVLNDVTTGGNGFCGGGSLQACADAVEKRHFAVNNPNAVYDGPADCSFPGRTASYVDPTTLTLSAQCNATAGFDGASGLGTPHGLGVFGASSPSAQLHALTTQGRRVTHTYTATVTPIVAGSRITSVNWSFGDGHTATGTRVQHAFGSAGRHVVTMTAVDSLFQRVTRHLVITVK